MVTKQKLNLFESSLIEENKNLENLDCVRFTGSVVLFPGSRQHCGRLGR